MRERCPLCRDPRGRSVKIEAGRRRWFCFRCEVGGSEPFVSREPVPEPPKYRRAKPHGDIPDEYLAWLGRYEIPVGEFRRLGGFWDGNRLAFNCPAFQARRSLTDKPKWLLVHDNPRLTHGWGDTGSNPIVLVEDSAAALKAALAGGYGYPVLGTHSSSLPSIPHGRRVIILPDPDPKGRQAARRHQWLLRHHSPAPELIDLNTEPKAIPMQTLKGIINGHSG